MNLTIPQQCP